MYIGDHLPAHFHAKYGDNEALVLIASGDIWRGSLPERASRLVKEWADLHRAELDQNWERARSEMPLMRIAPL